MNAVSVQHGDAHTIHEEEDCVGFECESQLLIAASMLARQRSGEISMTSVVGHLRGDEERFEKLVAEIADEYALDAMLCVEEDRFSVRFSIPVEGEVDGRVRSSGAPAWLARLLPRWSRAA